jgi:hypothetical protein
MTSPFRHSHGLHKLQTTESPIHLRAGSVLLILVIFSLLVRWLQTKGKAIIRYQSYKEIWPTKLTLVAY